MELRILYYSLKPPKSVPWTKPEDLTESIVEHCDGQTIRFVVADDSVRAMTPLDNDQLQKLNTRNGGETVR
jgi:hypothetical protein